MTTRLLSLFSTVFVCLPKLAARTCWLYQLRLLRLALLLEKSARPLKTYSAVMFLKRTLFAVHTAKRPLLRLVIKEKVNLRILSL